MKPCKHDKTSVEIIRHKHKKQFHPAFFQLHQSLADFKNACSGGPQEIEEMAFNATSVVWNGDSSITVFVVVVVDDDDDDDDDNDDDDDDDDEDDDDDDNDGGGGVVVVFMFCLKANNKRF